MIYSINALGNVAEFILGLIDDIERTGKFIGTVFDVGYRGVHALELKSLYRVVHGAEGNISHLIHISRNRSLDGVGASLLGNDARKRRQGF